MMRLDIKSKPGKTECFLQCKDHNSTARFASTSHWACWWPRCQSPAPGTFLTVVSSYKHLGALLVTTDQVQLMHNANSLLLLCIVCVCVRPGEIEEGILRSTVTVMLVLMLLPLLLLLCCVSCHQIITPQPLVHSNRGSCREKRHVMTFPRYSTRSINATCCARCSC